LKQIYIPARDLQQALARRGRAPYVMAGLPMFEELDALQETLAHCLALGDDPHLGHWRQVLRETLPAYRQNFAGVQLALDWVQAIGTILPTPVPTAAEPGPGGESVARHRAHYLGALADRLDLSPWLITFRDQDLLARSERYWAGLFPCYDLVGLPRPNNDHESLYGQLKRGLRRQRGVKDLREPLRRHGAWLVFQTEAGSAEKDRNLRNLKLFVTTMLRQAEIQYVLVSRFGRFHSVFGLPVQIFPQGLNITSLLSPTGTKVIHV